MHIAGKRCSGWMELCISKIEKVPLSGFALPGMVSKYAALGV